MTYDQDIIAEQDARIEQLKLANNRLYQNWLREKERNEKLEAAIDNAIGSLEILTLARSLGETSDSIGVVIERLRRAVDDE